MFLFLDLEVILLQQKRLINRTLQGVADDKHQQDSRQKNSDLA